MTKEKIEALKDAKHEAMRFVVRVHAALQELREQGGWGRTHFAAAKRASMDLSRALTRVRR